MLTGKAALDAMLEQTMAPIGFKPSKLPPYLGFFEKDGRFLQITRDWTAPFEAIVNVTTYAMRDGRLCISGSLGAAYAPPPEPKPAQVNPKAKPAAVGKLGQTKPKPAGPIGCVIPQIFANDETNIANLRGERLLVGANIELPNVDSLKIERFGPFRPKGFQTLPLPVIKGTTGETEDSRISFKVKI